MRRVFTFVSLIFFASFNTQAMTEQQFLSSFENMDVTSTLAQGEVEIFLKSIHPEDSAPLQGLIDSATEKIFSNTSLGQQILVYILNCNAELIENHLGTSSNMASLLSANCLNLRNNVQLNGRIAPSPPYALTKAVLGTKYSKRRFSFVVTNSPHLEFDSWTNSSTNRTYLFIPMQGHRGKINSSMLTHMLAHENAVYFDAKHWVGSPTWYESPKVSSISEFQEIHFKRDDRAVVFTALNNPLINQVTTYIRAFRIEKEITDELVSKNLIQALRLDLSIYKIFDVKCDEACLFSYVEKNSKNLLPLSLPYLAMSPVYRSQKMRAFRNFPRQGLSTSHFEGFQKTLVDLPKQMLQAMMPLFEKGLNFDGGVKGQDYQGLEFLSLLTKDQTLPDFKYAEQFMSEILLKEDLDTLKVNHLLLRTERMPQGLLAYMTQPLLSGFNVAFSYGPRPRIRTGGVTGD